MMYYCRSLRHLPLLERILALVNRVIKSKQSTHHYDQLFDLYSVAQTSDVEELAICPVL